MEQKMGGSRITRQGGISGSTLKVIGLIAMLVDHVGAVIVARMLIDISVRKDAAGLLVYGDLYQTYQVLRNIGRIAFPIYCFLLVEGFQKTGNKVKYVLRLGAFALLSEIPFDLAFSSRVIEFKYQNVFFTLFIGMAVMFAMDALDEKVRSTAEKKNEAVQSMVKYLTELVLFGAGAFLAELLRTDYGAKGIMCIIILYLFRWNKGLQLVAGACSFLWENFASIAFLPIAFYNGKRGWNLKYVFYVFYPLHLVILYFICVVMGIHGYPAV